MSLWQRFLKFLNPPEPKQPEAPKPVVAENSELPWLAIAFAERGQKEVPGRDDNPRILKYHATTTFNGKADEIPWCSSFVNWVFFKLSWDRTKSAAAKSWLNWGVKLKAPRRGCVVIKSRTGGNHVTFWLEPKVGQLSDTTKVTGFIGYGGNQANKVCEAWYPDNEVRGYRWPVEAKHMLKPEEIDV